MAGKKRGESVAGVALEDLTLGDLLRLLALESELGEVVPREIVVTWVDRPVEPAPPAPAKGDGDAGE